MTTTTARGLKINVNMEDGQEWFTPVGGYPHQTLFTTITASRGGKRVWAKKWAHSDERNMRSIVKFLKKKRVSKRDLDRLGLICK